MEEVIFLTGCYGSHPYDKYLERIQNEHFDNDKEEEKEEEYNSAIDPTSHSNYGNRFSIQGLS